MAFRTPEEFDRALKRAVRDSGRDLGAGYRQALAIDSCAGYSLEDAPTSF